MNEAVFNSVHYLNRPYTIAIRQQCLPRGVSNCMVFIFKYIFVKEEEKIYKNNIRSVSNNVLGLPHVRVRVENCPSVNELILKWQIYQIALRLIRQHMTLPCLTMLSDQHTRGISITCYHYYHHPQYHPHHCP